MQKDERPDPRGKQPVRTTSAHERNKAAPDAKDLADAKQVWRDGETTPARDREGMPGGDRVADAGDVGGGGNPSPYSIEAQADSVGEQTRRRPASPRKK